MFVVFLFLVHIVVYVVVVVHFVVAIHVVVVVVDPRNLSLKFGQNMVSNI